jgi:hypothetical protein
MIGAVGNNGLDYTSSGSTRHSMNESQKTAVQKVLSNYDSENLSSNDAKEISNSFKELGITPSSDLRQTIEDAGFDADAIRDMSGTSQAMMGAEGKQPPPPPPPPQQNNEEEQSILEEILAEILEGDDEDEANQLSQSEQIIDYTNRIIHLNDDAKNEVKELFDKFKPGNDTGFSKEETNNIITSSLKSILGDDNNYLHSDFYA